MSKLFQNSPLEGESKSAKRDSVGGKLLAGSSPHQIAAQFGSPSRGELTQSQKLATNPALSARVMANAGAGKTFVLTARVLRLLLKGVHPGKVLCLTYTKAAAAEMRSRIDEQLREWVLMDDARLRSELRNLIEAEPDEAQMAIAKKLFSKTLESSPPPRIQTIHSFCQDVLKRFPLESGVQPYFEVVDEVTSREMIKETTQILLSKVQVQHEVTEAIDYIAAIGGEWKFSEITGEIISQRNRIRDLFDKVSEPEELIEFIYKKNNISRALTVAEVIGSFWQFPEERVREIEKLVNALKSSKNVNDVARGGELGRALEQKNFEEYFAIFMTQKNEPRKKLITNDAKKLFADSDELVAFEQEQLLEALESLSGIENLEFTRHVVYLAYGILEVYEALKKSRAVIDYNDLIYTTKKLLTSGNAAWVLYKLDGGLEHILIDEAQDTSPEQWQIILALLEEFLAGEGAAERDRTIFIVGDEKQSIYSFQGADQKKFNEVTEYIRKKCVEAGKGFSDISLETSFRSVEAVLKVADTSFAPEEVLKSVASLGKISHELHRIGEGGHVEIWPIIKNEEKEELESWQLPLSYHTAKSADLLLAEKIADTVDEWLKTGRKLVSENRAVRPSDILILLRSRGNLADMLINRLKRKKIAVSGSDRLKITEHIAIQDLIALSNFLLLPDDDLSLAGALKSPLFGISEEDLFELSYKRDGSLWNSLRNNAKFKTIAETLSDLLGRVDYLSVYELYSLILDQQNGRKKLISRLGHEVNDVLDEFLNLAVNFERSHTNSLQQFISWVALSNMEIKRDMEAAGDEVRIMTVHGAKGLEAPIVFLADAAKMPSPKRQLVWDEEHFYGYRSKGKLFRNLKGAVEAAEMADYDEYLRLLYVAVTRARDELYVTGSIGEKNTNIDESWYRVIENGMGKLGCTRYETPHVKELRAVASVPVAEKIIAPDFIKKKLPREKPKFVEVDELEFNDFAEVIDYGKKVHKTLEIIGHVPAARRSEYLASVYPEGSNLGALLDKFPEIFGVGAMSEVPVIGRIDGEIITGRIDRLVVKENEVQIIDFKTTKNPPHIMPESYIKQLDIYAKIIGGTYPGRKLRKMILWTSTAQLVEL